MPFIEAIDLPIPVLRQRDARQESDVTGRLRWVGDSAFLSDHEALESNRQWWNVDPDSLCAAGLMAVSRSGFVVAVLRIDGVEATVTRYSPKSSTKGAFYQNFHRFEARLAGRLGALGEEETHRLFDRTVEAPYRELARLMLGKRTATRSGGPIGYLPGSRR